MIVKIDGYSKLQELRKNKDESYIIRTGEDIPTEFSVCIYHLVDIKGIEMYIFVIDEKIVWIYLSKR